MPSRFARTLATAAFAVVVALGATASPVEAAAAALPPPSDTNFGKARIVWLINEERRVRGLGAVERNAGADHIAQYSANIQAWVGRLGHNPNLPRDVTERVGGGWRVVSENIGCGGDADHLHAMWMRSSGHARNVLYGGNDTVGVGAAYARGCLWATVVFVDR